MKLAVTLQWNTAFSEIAALTLPVLQSYCVRHGYTLFANHSERVSPEIVWERVEDVLRFIDEFDAVAHVDADCLITNPEISLESLMQGRDSTDLFMSEDCNGINDGFHIWRRTWQSKLMLKELSQQNTRNEFSSPQDQLAKYLKRTTDYRPIEVHVFRQRETNSYLSGAYGAADENADWQPNDFILHCPGMGNDRRVEAIKGHLPFIIS